MNDGTGTKRQLELKLTNGHVQGRFKYKNVRDLIRDILILVGLGGFGYNTVSLQDVQAKLALCQAELRNVQQNKSQNQFQPIQPGESFSDYIQRTSKLTNK